MLRRDLRARRLQCRNVGIDIGLADCLRRKLLQIALVGLIRELGGRLQLLQFGVVIVRLEPQQYLAQGNFIAGIESDFIDHTGGLRREVRAADRAQGSSRLNERLPLRGGGLDGGDSLRGRRRRGHAFFEHAAEKTLHAENCAKQQYGGDQHDHDGLDHRPGWGGIH